MEASVTTTSASIDCEQCSGPISDARRRRKAKFCSDECSAAFKLGRYRTANPSLGVPPSTVGAIAELLVSTDLLKRGYEVFRALSPSSSCDLAVLLEGRLLRVEVTTAYYNNSGVLFHPDKKHGRAFDVLALVVMKTGEVVYRPPLVRDF